MTGGISLFKGGRAKKDYRLSGSVQTEILESLLLFFESAFTQIAQGFCAPEE